MPSTSSLAAVHAAPIPCRRFRILAMRAPSSNALADAMMMRPEHYLLPFYTEACRSRHDYEAKI